MAQQITQMIADVDKDGSGAIDFNEFVHMMAPNIGERDTKEELMKVFQIIDHDNNQKISLEDIKRIAKDLGENFTDQELQEMVEEAERDRDGEVNFDEFIRMMKRTTYDYYNFCSFFGTIPTNAKGVRWSRCSFLLAYTNYKAELWSRL